MIDNKISEIKTLGIIAIIIGLFVPIAGIVISCVGLSKLSSLPVASQFGYDKELKYKKAKNLCIAGIVVPIVLWLLGLIFFVIVWGIILGGMTAMSELALLI